MHQYTIELHELGYELLDEVNGLLITRFYGLKTLNLARKVDGRWLTLKTGFECLRDIRKYELTH